MTERRVSVSQAVLEQIPSLSLDELDTIQRLCLAIGHSIVCAEELASTLNPRARALIITKLEEANHWCLELTRIAGK